ncbi:MAG: hypothetical protein ACP5UO_06050 [Thermoplasmata archaeon]
MGTVYRAIKADHERYIKCRLTNGRLICHVVGSPNDVRKTLNEFLESIIYLERISAKIDARVG